MFSFGPASDARDRLSAGGCITAKLNDDFAFFDEYDAIVPAGNLLQQTLGLSYRF